MTPVSSNVIFHVSDMEKSMAFYTQQLGFNIDFQLGSPATYCALLLGPVQLHLSSQYPYKNNTGHGSLYVVCDEIDTLNARLVQAGVAFYSSIDDREYGMRDFAIKDPDENQIGFGVELASYA